MKTHRQAVTSYRVQAVQFQKRVVAQKKSVDETIKKIRSKKLCSRIVQKKHGLYEVGIAGGFGDVLQFLRELKHEQGAVDIKRFVCNKGKGGKVEALLYIRL